MRAFATRIVPVFLVVCGCYGLTDDEWARVQVWLTSEHADSATLAYVDSLGRARERETVSVLGKALEEGPSEQFRRNYRHALAGQWEAIEPDLDPGLSFDQYSAHFLGNYVASYQMRAATALASIATPSAMERLREAVDGAERRGYREDVARHIGRAYAVSAYPVYGGGLSSPVGFLEPIRLDPDPARPWSGDVSMRIPAAAFPEPVLRERWGTDSLAFVAGAWPGSYELLVTAGAASADTLRARLVVQTRRYPTHSRAAPLELDTLVAPRELFTALSWSLARPGGTVTSGQPLDHLRLWARDDTAFLARIDWTGAVSVLPTWHPCGAGSAPGIHGTVFDAQGNAGPFAVVRELSRGSAQLADSLGHFHLAVGDDPAYDLVLQLPGREDTIPDVPSPSSSALLYGPRVSGSSLQFTRPDTSVVHVAAGGCTMLRLAKLDAADVPSLVRISLEPVPRTRRAELRPAGPVQLRHILRPVARLTLELRDHLDRPIRRPITWRSRDPAVATVDPAGLVTARDTGTTRIYAFTSGVPPQSVEVVVSP